MRVAVILPVFNDWLSFEAILDRLDRIAGELRSNLSVFAVDDGSTAECSRAIFDLDSRPHIASLEVIDLVANFGSQRAIAIGLCEVAARPDFDTIIVMDADGEDDPDDVPRLLRAATDNPGSVILAHRASRSEGAVFRTCYRVYKSLFHTLTGHRISFGHFCVLPAKAARRLTFKSNLWNSLPGTVLMSRLPYITVPTRRGRRLNGRSHMNFVGLVIFGLHTMTVFSDAVMVRLALMVAGAIAVLGISVAVTRLVSDQIVLGWASAIIVVLAALGVQVLFLLLNASLLVLHHRSLMQMIPALQYKPFIRAIERAARTAPAALA